MCFSRIELIVAIIMVIIINNILSHIVISRCQKIVDKEKNILNLNLRSADVFI
jgi:hypothetical protein